MEKGISILYLPEINDGTGPQKAYFLFKTEKFNSTSQYPRIIITTDESNISRFTNIEDFREKQKALPTLNDDGKIVFLSNLDLISRYSDYRLNRANELYLFLLKYEQTYKSIVKYLKLFTSNNETLFYSNYFIRLRRNFSCFRIRFWLKMVLFLILGTLKFLLYPFIFFLDIIKSTFETYTDYKKAQVSASYYSSGSLKMKMAYLGVGEEEFNKEKEANEAEVKHKKTNYITTNITVLTLILAILGFLITGLTGWIDKKNSDNKLETLQDKYDIAIDKNQILERKLDQQSDYMKRIDYLNEIIVNKSIVIDRLENEILEMKIKEKK